nr:EOG090X08O3 [Cyclestheria hislopi]
MASRNVSTIDSDEAVRATNDEASICKRFAVHMGYWKDPYISFLVRSAERKTPEINRGYFARVKGIQRLVHKFLKITKGDCQIVNLGAGFDSLYWQLHGEKWKLKAFVEFDYPNVTSRKCFCIKNNAKLLEALKSDDGEVQVNSSELHSGVYHLVAGDLRKLTQLEQKLSECHLDFQVPTLFLFECVLVYIPIESSSVLLNFLANRFSSCFCISYEQVNMMDKFGDVMMSNLKGRGCILAGVEACRSLKTQEDRFINSGWSGAISWEMNHVYHSLPKDEIQRIEKIEFLDEKELLEQLFHHYCITVAWKGAEDLQFQAINLD